MAGKALILTDVEKEYEKVKELNRDDVKKLMNWADLQPHLPKLTEMQVIHFLHSNYFRSEAAKKCIDNFFTVRTHCPEFFSNRDPLKIDNEVLLYTALPKVTQEGYKVIYAKLMDTNPDNYTFPIQIKKFDMVTMLTLNRDGTCPGEIIIHDLTGVTFTHLTKLNLLLLKKFFFYLQECMPVRIKGLHFINPGNLMEKILSLIKPFMKKELCDVLYTHTDISTIYKHVPKECFPSDFEGGTAMSTKELHEALKKDLVKNREFFVEEEKQKVDESKRQGKPKNAGELFGVEGTFKRLDID